MSDAVPVDVGALRRFLAAEPAVVCATLFGSAQGGSVRPGGDVDIAVLFRGSRPGAREFLAFYSRLCDAVPTIERVDLVPLNDAHPILAFEAIQGQFLVKNDPEATAAFFSLVCREYEDVMADLERQRRLRASAA